MVVGGTYYAYLVAEVDVAGQRTEVVHDVVDAEVVAVDGVGRRGISGDDRPLLVERHLAHTVDGVVGVVHLLGHTVLGTLHHHAAAEHATEVGTLDGVHQTTGIDGQHTALLPVGPDLGLGTHPFCLRSIRG